MHPDQLDYGGLQVLHFKARPQSALHCIETQDEKILAPRIELGTFRV